MSVRVTELYNYWIINFFAELLVYDNIKPISVSYLHPMALFSPLFEDLFLNSISYRFTYKETQGDLLVLMIS